MKSIRSFSLVALTALSITTGASATANQLSTFAAFKSAVNKRVESVTTAIGDTWAQMPDRGQISVMVQNEANDLWFQLTAPGGYVRKNPVTVGATVAAAVAVTAAGYYAYSKGYFGKAYNAVKARFSKKN